MRTLEFVLQLIVIYTVCVRVMDAPVRPENKCDVKYQELEQQNKTEAEVGTNITIPCVPKFTINWKDDIITWEKDTKVIFNVKNGKLHWQNKTLKDRIDINISKMKEEKHASFTVSNVTKLYEGDYCCRIQRWNCDEKWMHINHTVVIKDKKTPTDNSFEVTQHTLKVRNGNDNSSNVTNVTGKIVGSILGILMLGGAAICLIFCFCKKKDNRQSQPQENRNDDHPQKQPEEQKLREGSTNQHSNDTSIEMRPRKSSEEEQLMAESTDSKDINIKERPPKSQKQMLQIREGIRHRTSS